MYYKKRSVFIVLLDIGAFEILSLHNKCHERKQQDVAPFMGPRPIPRVFRVQRLELKLIVSILVTLLLGAFIIMRNDSEQRLLFVGEHHGG